MLFFSVLIFVIALFVVVVRAEEQNWGGRNGGREPDCCDDDRREPNRCRDDCRCPARQSLIYRSSAEPPYCQRIYFPGRNSIRCCEGYVGACFNAVATHRVSCPRRRPFRCPNGFWLVRGTQGKFNCIKVARPSNFNNGCREDEYAVCLKIKPVDCKLGGLIENQSTEEGADL